jgi:NADH:ubiquinone oxidoreductase subunit 5 (subunit L)/multisubunit Na+/H+ antiporter MnhA subunit
MGGLLRRLPLVGGLFLVGALGAACLPPLNGFAGEFLLFLSALAGIGGHPAPGILVGVLAAAIAALALTGGLAAAAYARVFSFVFLGAPRSPSPSLATPESGGKVRFVPPAILAFLALFMALSSPAIMSIVQPAAERVARSLEGAGGGADRFGIEIKSWESLPQILASLAEGGALLLIALLAAFALRRALFRGKPRGESPTWDCGYARPTPRMQYNASSFARPLTKTFGWVVGLSDKITRPEGLFPRASSFASSLGDINTARGYRQIFGAVGWLAAKVRVLQAGRAQLYLLYIAIILIALLLWKM